MASVIASVAVDPTSPTLDNPSFARLVIAVLAGAVIVSTVWRWFRS